MGVDVNIEEGNLVEVTKKNWGKYILTCFKTFRLYDKNGSTVNVANEVEIH